MFVPEQTVDRHTPSGDLSMAAVLSIEQFGRMNGVNGKKMQKIFKGLVPEPIRNDARNLVEYCCFRFLSRETSEIHPRLKEPAFQRLIYVTMLAWEQPYTRSNNYSAEYLQKDSFQLKGKLVGEEAFVRIAPAVSGVADWSTAYDLFKALADDEGGISFTSWSTYINELLKVHDEMKSYEFRESPNIYNERVLCIASGGKYPVLKWKNNMVWPGTLTLTDKALYFEAAGLKGKRDASRLGLTEDFCHVKKTRVGLFGFDVLDSAISVSSGPASEAWVLEFIDLRGEMRRDVWYACINEVIALHRFIRDFAPEADGDHGKTKATTYATNAIARLRALQASQKLLEDPNKLVQFSNLQDSPYGDVMLQTLAVNCWSTPLNSEKERRPPGTHDAESAETHAFDIDGTVYLRKWMRSPTWASNSSLSFWRTCLAKHDGVNRVVVLSKDLVVGDQNLMEKAAMAWRDKCSVVEKTQATINAATIQGIPSNIDLLKELMLPLVVTANNFEKLRRWEDPLLTASCLALTYTLIFKDMVTYVFPAALMALAGGMLLMKGLKEQGRLGRYFGKVTIRDQPPSNTLQKIIALKEALRDLEMLLQSLNVSLLKIRSVVLAGQPQITKEVALVLLFSAALLLIVPFRYILSFVIFDLFTRELEFRRQMVLRFMSFLKDRWDTVPAATVVVLPYETDESEDRDGHRTREINKDSRKSEKTRRENDE
ncbi:unnamed protein product [Cuscuta campestris]|uniref:Uncharacterized protein n=1 Tax=Cuscuta campestris TaxID=132261 RepID=A0A484MLG0_9ASTE|nr:unnamed protein product [Cuscuta campestris]